MPTATQTGQRVVVADAADLDASLNAAVEAVIPEATRLNQGIRVTRVAPGEYIVEPDTDVPCRYTYETH